MDKTNNFKLKLLKFNQAQKEVLINEAIIILDAMASRIAIDIVDEIPINAEDGDIYIISKDNQVVLWLNGWRYFAPKNGWEFWISTVNKKYRFHNNDWSIV